MDLRIVMEHLEWFCPRVADNRSALDLSVLPIFNGGFRFTSTSKFN